MTTETITAPTKAADEVPSGTIPVRAETLADVLGCIYRFAAEPGTETEALSAVRLYVREGHLVATATDRYAIGWMREKFRAPEDETPEAYEGRRVSLPVRLIKPLLADIENMTDQSAWIYLSMVPDTARAHVPGAGEAGKKSVVQPVRTTIKYPAGRGEVSMTGLDLDTDYSGILAPLIAGEKAEQDGMNVTAALLRPFTYVEALMGTPLELSFVWMPGDKPILRATCGTAFLGALMACQLDTDDERIYYRGGVPGQDVWQSLIAPVAVAR